MGPAWETTGLDLSWVFVSTKPWLGLKGTEAGGALAQLLPQPLHSQPRADPARPGAMRAHIAGSRLGEGLWRGTGCMATGPRAPQYPGDARPQRPPCESRVHVDFRSLPQEADRGRPGKGCLWVACPKLPEMCPAACHGLAGTADRDLWLR